MIAVYGATGYTGRLVARELARRGLEATLCGRDQGKLDALVRELGDELETEFQVRAARVDEPAELRRALLGAQTVINCAGPFTYYGAPVIEAALDVGAHYCDTTGEQPYMQRVFQFVDAPAREKGKAVVPAVGFDYVPGDLACALAARGLEPLRDLVVGYSVKGFGATRGTLHSGLEFVTEGEEYVDGRWRPAGRPPLDERFAFPPPIGEQPVVRFPGGEVVTAPRHVDVRNVRVGLSARALAPHPAVAPAVPAVMGLVVRPLLRTPARDVLDSLIDRLPEGPDEDARRRSAFTIVADAYGEDGATRRAVVEGEDVYGLTAVMAVELARRMADEGFDGSGALAPAQVVDAEEFLGFLADHGVRHRVE